MTVEERDEIQADEQARQQRLLNRIYCCTAAGCISCGADGVRNAIAAQISNSGMEGQVEVCGTGCMGMCSKGPLVRSHADDALYGHVTAEESVALVSTNPADRQLLASKRIDTSAPFFASQMKIVLANSGRVDPEILNDYIAARGYRALAHAVAEMSAQDVLAEVKSSGLRGRGGAGYPTGVKWELVAKQKSHVKYIVCNADEGDPGAFMDRSVLEGDPHRVLEGMAIAGYAVGAQQGYIYVRGEYRLAIQRLQTAIKQASAAGFSAIGFFGTGFQFRIDLRIGAGAFVCGEETALIASIEGKRGQPRQRPPYPPESGCGGGPRSSTTSRHLPISRRSSRRAASGSPPSGPRPAREPRYSRLRARSSTPA